MKKAIFSGSLIGILGLIILPFINILEEDIGLDILFLLRGERKAPPDVVIITVDKESADHLGLPPEPYKWPRSLHGQLTRVLAEKGAQVITFDLIFKESGPGDTDSQFAKFIREAGNVVLCEQINKDILPVTGSRGMNNDVLKIESLIPLVPSLAQSAIATAPFPLPKVPVTVRQYWTFKPSAGGIPTLPVVSFQVFTSSVYDDFSRMLKKVSPAPSAFLPLEFQEAVRAEGILNLTMVLRTIFEQEPSLGKKLLSELDSQAGFLLLSKEACLIKSLIALYQGENSSYLDFYGPTGTIQTIPFYRMIPGGDPDSSFLDRIDLKGKAVFVGVSERLRPEEKDGFHTTFSQKNGIDLSGVEIAATAFANLLENRRVRPLATSTEIALIFSAGLLLGFFCLLLPTSTAAVTITTAGTIYVAAAHYSFRATGIWLPLVLPIMVQAPFAFFGSVLWKYLETHKERENIRKALGYYVPGKIADQMAKRSVDIRSNKQMFEGTCLCTDAERYTTLSETMAPDILGQVMNDYFNAIFAPVKANQGTISEVVGDSMIAIWPGTKSEDSHRIKACSAALDMAEAVNNFNRSNPNSQLPTRIGLHTGRMMIGNIGAMDRYEFNPVGDMVNTASRIEGLNKHLGTMILASQEVVADLDLFLMRELGSFILAGKSKPIVVYEILCRKENATRQKQKLCLFFEKALEKYRNQNWEKGISMFAHLIKTYDGDGPSQFYLDQCNKINAHPPAGPWDGLINMNIK